MLLHGTQKIIVYLVFQRSWAFFTFAIAVSAVKGGTAMTVQSVDDSASSREVNNYGAISIDCSFDLI
jgi:hypothetical protein